MGGAFGLSGALPLDGSDGFLDSYYLGQNSFLGDFLAGDASDSAFNAPAFMVRCHWSKLFYTDFDWLDRIRGSL